MSFKNERFLVNAIEECQFYKIISCFKHGHNFHTVNDQGQNLLMHLLKQQHKHQNDQLRRKRFEIFQFLIVHARLSIEYVDHLGKNIFNWACNLNCTDEAMHLLQTYPGDLGLLQRDHSGSCSLHYAIEHGNELLVRSIIDYLVQYRLRFDVEDSYGNSLDVLAEKLGFHELSDFLVESIRSTVYVSREINPQRFIHPMANKFPQTPVTKTSFPSFSSSLSGSSFSIPSLPNLNLNATEFYSITESKINKAKQLNDWKTVAVLRAYQANSQGKKFHELPAPKPQVDLGLTNLTKKLPKIELERVSTEECQRLFGLLEPQLTSSYRQAFIPYYERPVIRQGGFGRASMAHRKASQASSRRQSTLLSTRRRESSSSQIGDGINRLLMPSSQKQQRQSVVTPRVN